MLCGQVPASDVWAEVATRVHRFSKRREGGRGQAFIFERGREGRARGVRPLFSNTARTSQHRRDVPTLQR
jgi:hypothetical protein